MPAEDQNLLSRVSILSKCRQARQLAKAAIPGMSSCEAKDLAFSLPNSPIVRDNKRRYIAF